MAPVSQTGAVLWVYLALRIGLGTQSFKLKTKSRNSCPEAHCPEVQCPDFNSRMSFWPYQPEITFGDVRASGVREVLVYCADGDRTS